MGSNKTGFINENEMVAYLNNKKISELNNNMKSFIMSIFDNVTLDSLIKAGKIGGQVKPDCFVEIDNVRKNISLKMGSGNSVHQEPLSLFCAFLESNGVSDSSVNTIKLFNYADGTIDGEGVHRVNASQFCLNNPILINECNQEINNNEELMIKLFNRFLFKGVLALNPVVDVAYHGTIDEGLWATREEIIEFLLQEKTEHKGIFFSNLSYQVWNRCLNYNPKTENRRHTMQVKWSSMVRDVVKITNRR